MRKSKKKSYLALTKGFPTARQEGLLSMRHRRPIYTAHGERKRSIVVWVVTLAVTITIGKIMAWTDAR